ncbi:hydrogenase 2 maturation endopeptidase [Mycobacterium basiliense]|uniref:Hydrogenase 2 maturation endopeptidase n=1 Tax=Mycobacterium basiliense TaxID=2094119 RepID=A0A447GGB2_9MYCO|nr:hydrogenase maturation protease [Mycobacterium basiliense]VDM89530.1 hydrogenase 2 maturation endopeptidase [Mycobacterium basiliense]
MKAVVIGLGNRFRRDDGVGVVAAGEISELALPGVAVVTGVVEPLSLLEAWSGVELAVVIDAAVRTPSTPGRVIRCSLTEVVSASAARSSHRVDVAGSYALGQVLGRVPAALEVFVVEVADTGHGVGLTPQVAAAVPELVRMAREAITGADEAKRATPVAARRTETAYP